jgi:hypothetical protein
MLLLLREASWIKDGSLAIIILLFRALQRFVQDLFPKHSFCSFLWLHLRRLKRTQPRFIPLDARVSLFRRVLGERRGDRTRSDRARATGFPLECFDVASPSQSPPFVRPLRHRWSDLIGNSALKLHRLNCSSSATAARLQFFLKLDTSQHLVREEMARSSLFTFSLHRSISQLKYRCSVAD